MKTELFYSFIACACLTACTSITTTDALPTAHVAEAVANPTPLTTSMLGSRIRFVPLETTDSSLIGGRNIMSASDNRLIVSNFSADPSILVFDLENGRFLNRISQKGNGPEDFNNPFHILSSDGETVYLQSPVGNGLLTFAPDGTFRGNALQGVKFWDYSGLIAGDSTLTLITHKAAPDDRGFGFIRFNRAAEAIDSVHTFDGQKTGVFPNSFTGYTDFKSFPGILGDQMQTLTQVTNQGKTYVAANLLTRFIGGDIHFRETLCDTIYKLTPAGAEPVIVFDMDGNAFPVEELNIRPVKSSELVITDLIESPDKVVFGLSKGWPIEEDHTEYIGIFNIASGTTGIGKAADGIKDDLGNFIPFKPAMTTPKGDFIAVVQPEAIEEWLEENPDAQRPEWVGNLKSDDNPVLVIISK